MKNKTKRSWGSEDASLCRGHSVFCSGHPCCHKIVNCVPGAGPKPLPTSCTGAAVSCLKLAVGLWTHQSFCLQIPVLHRGNSYLLSDHSMLLNCAHCSMENKNNTTQCFTMLHKKTNVQRHIVGVSDAR